MYNFYKNLINCKKALWVVMVKHKKRMGWKQCIAILSMTVCLLLFNKTCYGAEILEIESPCVVLMELSSGQILYEKDADTSKKPASVTKIMTMLLVFDALEDGQLALTDEIVVSQHAAGMGGSQVYLEQGEVQTVKDLLKCMIVSSANDAAVAISEAVAGSEEAFVEQMNQRAKQLGMEHTHFENVCGLEAENHYMSAKDVAILSRELILTHPEVFEYSTIWMDTILHKTAKGESEFGLANTNKFLKKYEGANGLKTGYTKAAGFSMSATATRNGMTLIAVVMGSSTKEIRYSDAGKLLDYGFANCSLYQDTNVLGKNNRVAIKHGISKEVLIAPESDFSYVLIGNAKEEKITKKICVSKKEAPIKKGEKIGYMEYFCEGDSIGKVYLTAQEEVDKENYSNVFLSILHQYANLSEK